MDTNDNSNATATSEPKRTYVKPELVELGDVRELTKSSAAGSRSDGFRRRSG